MTALPYLPSLLCIEIVLAQASNLSIAAQAFLGQLRSEIVWIHPSSCRCTNHPILFPRGRDLVLVFNAVSRFESSCEHS